jgi:hypothetical protein
MDRLRVADAAGLDALMLFADELHAAQHATAMAQWETYSLWLDSETGEFLGVISPEGKCRRLTRCYGWPCWACEGGDENERGFWSTISATNICLQRYARQMPELRAQIETHLVNPKHAFIAAHLIARRNNQNARLSDAVQGGLR